MAPRLRSAVGSAAALLTVAGIGSCHASRLETAVGRHIVMHWDPAERQICGGTLEYVDRTLEVVAQHYGLSLPERPAIDLILSEDLSLALALCRREAGGCTATYPNGTALMLLDRSVHEHELTHAIRLTGTRQIMPRFFREGVAVRWETGPAELESTKQEYVGDLDYRTLHAWLDGNDIPTNDYFEAGFLWAWLEAEYGPDAMALFGSRLQRFASADEIEHEFARTFDISLEAAADASRGSPLLMFDIHACAMLELPTQSWAGEPLSLFDDASSCADDGVVDIRARAVQFVRLELPEQPAKYQLLVEGPADSELRFDACRGSARPYEYAATFGPSPLGVSVELGGSYVLTRYTPIAEDGSVDFPHVELSAQVGPPW